MKKAVCSVFDTVSGVYSNPFYSANLGTAIRDFQFAAQDKSTEIGRHPGDFYLFQLGEYDDVNCSFSLLPAPQRVLINSTTQE